LLQIDYRSVSSDALPAITKVWMRQLFLNVLDHLCTLSAWPCAMSIVT